MENARVKALIKLEYRVKYQNPIRVKAGETVEVGRTDGDYPGWVWYRAVDGREGWMPLELISKEGSLAIVLRDYSARELNVRAGDEIEVEDVRHGWALVRNHLGESGWVPKSHVEM